MAVLKLGAKAYIGCVLALGVLAAIRGLLLWKPVDPLLFSLYVLLAAFASGLKVRLPGVNGSISVLFVFLLAGIVELGLPHTLMAAAVCVIVQSYWRPAVRPRFVQVVFSMAVLFVASTAAHAAYSLPSVPRVYEAAPLRLALLGSVFFAFNTFPVAAVIALTENRRIGPVWREFYSWTFPFYVLGAALVGLFGFVNRTIGWHAWVLILPAMYLMYRSYSLFLERLENQRRRTEEERRHAREVAELLKQTISANESLRRANADLEQFAYAASHDLQEPLRMIALYSQMLDRRHSQNLGPDGKLLLDTITDSANRINDLVRDLLSYTNAGSPDETLPSPVHPGEILREVQQTFANSVASLDAVIITGELAPVRVHRAHLVQLLQNLLSNSLKYSSPERRLCIHLSSVPAENGMLEFMFRDNGIGIDPVYHDRIFGVFRRLHSRDVPGTGVGLAICKKIVEYSGGRIWVESRAGDGSTFHFTLPAAGSASPRSAVPPTAHPAWPPL